MTNWTEGERSTVIAHVKIHVTPGGEKVRVGPSAPFSVVSVSDNFTVAETLALAEALKEAARIAEGMKPDFTIEPSALEPPIGSVVRDRDDETWTRTANGWRFEEEGFDRNDWMDVLRYAPLTIVNLPTDGSEAVR